MSCCCLLATGATASVLFEVVCVSRRERLSFVCLVVIGVAPSESSLSLPSTTLSPTRRPVGLSRLPGNTLTNAQ